MKNGGKNKSVAFIILFRVYRGVAKCNRVLVLVKQKTHTNGRFH